MTSISSFSDNVSIAIFLKSKGPLKQAVGDEAVIRQILIINYTAQKQDQMYSTWIAR